MQKKLTLILLFLVAFIFSGCLSTEINHERLWKVDINQKGYQYQHASHIIKWSSNDDGTGYGIGIVLSVRPTKYFDMDYENLETRIVDNITYYFEESSICWDADDGSGETHIRKVICIKGKYAYLINVGTNKEELLESFSFEETIELINNPQMVLDGFDGPKESWSTKLYKDDISIVIYLEDTQNDYKILKEAIEEANVKLIKEDEIEYYISDNSNRSKDDSNIKSIFWQSDIGLIWIHAGVSYDERNNVPDDALDFINIDFAKDIIEQIKGR